MTPEGYDANRDFNCQGSESVQLTDEYARGCCASFSHSFGHIGKYWTVEVCRAGFLAVDASYYFRP